MDSQYLSQCVKLGKRSISTGMMFRTHLQLQHHQWCPQHGPQTLGGCPPCPGVPVLALLLAVVVWQACFLVPPSRAYPDPLG